MLDPLSGEFESEQIGSFFSFAKATDEFGVSLIGEARIPKRNQVLCETLLKMYERRELNFSFEILVNAMEERDGVWVINAAEDLPRSFLVCADGTVYLSGLNSATLLRRAENETFE